MKFRSLFLGLVILGLAVALFDTYDIMTQSFNVCNINSVLSCGAVFKSGYTSIGGAPFWALGDAWFALMALLIVLRWNSLGTANPTEYLYFMILLMVGNVFTIYLWYLQIAVIHAFCPVCITLYLISYATTVLLAMHTIRSY